MVILRRGVKALFASFAGGREDGERPHQPEGGRAGRLRGPVQNQEAHPAEQADEGLLREAGALRAGRGACGCASVRPRMWALLHVCMRVHGCVHTCVCVFVCMCVSVHACASLCGPSLPSSPGRTHRLSQQTHCPPFPRRRGVVASSLGGRRGRRSQTCVQLLLLPTVAGPLCGDAALVTVWFPDSA